VANSRIGVCLQIPERGVEKLSSIVRYTDNDMNLDATSLPFPEASPPI